MRCANPKCGKEFEPSTPRQKYCCSKCKYQDYYRLRVKGNDQEAKRCVVCGAAVEGKEKYCKDCRSKKNVAANREWRERNKERWREYNKKNLREKRRRLKGE